MNCLLFLLIQLKFPLVTFLWSHVLLEGCCFHLHLFVRFSKHGLAFDVIHGGIAIISVLLRLLRLALKTPNIVLCWWILHERRMCILLWLDRQFYKCKFGQIDWLCSLGQPHSCWFLSALILISGEKKNFKVTNWKYLLQKFYQILM